MLQLFYKGGIPGMVQNDIISSPSFSQSLPIEGKARNVSMNSIISEGSL